MAGQPRLTAATDTRGNYDVLIKRNRQGNARTAQPSTVSADFPGDRTAVGSMVAFMTRDGRRIDGKVAELRAQTAVVGTGTTGRWRVPYASLHLIAPAPGKLRSLREADALVRPLLEWHKRNYGLAAEWRLEYDLAKGRAGVCRPTYNLICLAVSFCLTAPEDELTDTMLHEIAHAIVGCEHGHDDVWKRTARRIGCTGDRCTDVKHTAAKWIGRCKCNSTGDAQLVLDAGARQWSDCAIGKDRSVGMSIDPGKPPPELRNGALPERDDTLLATLAMQKH